MNETIEDNSDEVSLEELLSEVTPENCHEEIESTGPVGKEFW